MIDGYMSGDEAAEALGVSRQRVKQLAKGGLLEYDMLAGEMAVIADSVARRIQDGPRRGNPGISGREVVRSDRKPHIVTGYMNLTQAAEALGISKGRLSILISEGKVRAGKFGKAVVIEESEVERRKAENPGHGNPNFGPGYNGRKRK